MRGNREVTTNGIETLYLAVIAPKMEAEDQGVVQKCSILQLTITFQRTDLLIELRENVAVMNAIG